MLIDLWRGCLAKYSTITLFGGKSFVIYAAYIGYTFRVNFSRMNRIISKRIKANKSLGAGKFPLSRPYSLKKGIQGRKNKKKIQREKNCWKV
jgi:hypothetical protein